MPLAFVALSAVWSAWLGFRVQTAGDYPGDFAPSMNALLAGHVGGFLRLLPMDGAGGSILLRAPVALIGKVLVGSRLAIFRFGALECILASGALGLFLARRMRAAGRSVAARAAVVTLCTLAPAMLDSVRFGHPEEALGAALCVAAVLLAGARRATLAGVVLGLALINKPWALVAVGPVLLATPAQRGRVAAIAGSMVGAWIGAVWLVASARLAVPLSPVVHPPDLWWPLAHLRSRPGVMPAYFLPRVVADHARELVVALAVPLSVPLARRRGRSAEDCLALLAFLFLVRCMLDPSNHVYYQVPLVIATAAWEARTRGAPVLALAATAGYWLVFHVVSGPGTETAQFAAYLAVSLPLAIRLGAAALAIPRARPVGGSSCRKGTLAACASSRCSCCSSPWPAAAAPVIHT